MNKIVYVFAVVILWPGCTKNTVTDVSTTDCSTVTGATFSSNNGQMYSLISANCSGSSCHSPGGSESGRFLVTNNYTSIQSSLSNAARTVLSGSMPRTGSLSSSELQKWQCWSNSGFPK